jgi:hypothetical protein
MPVLSRDHKWEARHQAVNHLDDLIPLCYSESASGTEIVLNVYKHQRITLKSDLHLLNLLI